MKFVNEKMINWSMDDGGLVKTNEIAVKAAGPANPEILLGQFINDRIGVCRHKALLYKILADEIGLDVSLVRGAYGRERHVWNTVKLEDGSSMLVDPACKKAIRIEGDYKKLDTEDQAILNSYKSAKDEFLYAPDDIKAIQQALYDLMPGEKFTIRRMSGTDDLTLDTKIPEASGAYVQSGAARSVAEIEWTENGFILRSLVDSNRPRVCYGKKLYKGETRDLLFDPEIQIGDRAFHLDLSGKVNHIANFIEHIEEESQIVEKLIAIKNAQNHFNSLLQAVKPY